MAALRDALVRLAASRDLSGEDVGALMEEVLSGGAHSTLLAALLTAWHIKGESTVELAAVVGAVRARMVPLEGAFPPLLDTCGTGGDGASTFNVSTATAIVTAACGVPVAKHGNRSASGTSGSAEVLTELGLAIAPEISVVQRCLDELGITFLFAPKFHPALGHLAAVRKALPFRTVFNLVGPLANPARPAFQLIGVPNARLAERMARVLVELGTDRAAVVTGAGGLDEVSLAGPTHVIWVERGATMPEIWSPEDFNLPHVAVEDLRVDDPATSAQLLRCVLASEVVPARSVVLANVAAALLVARKATDLKEGACLGAEAIDSGAAARLLARWVELAPA